MKRIILIGLLGISQTLPADPASDRTELLRFYQQRFPKLVLQDYAQGAYAIDDIARSSWLAIEAFPPYQPAIEQGEEQYKKAFKNGHHYAECLPQGGLGIAQHYPQWDNAKQKVITLAQALNDCRSAQHEPPLDTLKGELANILAYLAYTSRGKIIAITVPANNPQALWAYEQGKAFYYQRRGQLNFSCAVCHIQNAGKKLRTETLSPALGHINNWPTYRLKWGDLGTIQKRFIECLEQIKASTYPPQSEELNHLEYFLATLANGIAMTAPSTRK